MDHLCVLDNLILNRRAFSYEASVFAQLSQCPHVVRAFEMAPLDGAIDCSLTYRPDTSYASRFSHLIRNQTLAAEPSRLLLFDVKSTIGRHSQKQIMSMSGLQRTHAAFFVRICAADTNFVEIIPNMMQNAQGDDLSMLVENTSCLSAMRSSGVYLPLPAPSYRLDPMFSPFRMPFSMLREAISRIREAVTHERPYVNPWTQVEFSEWKPHLTESTTLLKPAEHGEFFTSFLAIQTIYRFVMAYEAESGLAMDFILHQPSLADFKFVFKDARSQQRQVFIQHKLQTQGSHSRRATLRRIRVARTGMTSGKSKVHWFFAAQHRFDFIWFQIEFRDRSNIRPHIEIYFLPERVIPDEFYTSESDHADFSRPAFNRYRMHMDPEGHWVSRIGNIIRSIEYPRKPGTRPRRIVQATSSDGDDNEDHQPDNESGTCYEFVENTLTAPAQAYEALSALCEGDRRLYDGISRYCASRRSGLLVPLGPQIYGYCRYIWTTGEKAVYDATGRPPKNMSTLCPETPLLLLSFHSQGREATAYGPLLQAGRFEQLNRIALPRLLLWDMSGADSRCDALRPAVIPSTDFEPSETQRRRLAIAFGVGARDFTVDDFFDQAPSNFMPSLTAVLNTGLIAAEYVVNSRGPLLYDDRPNDCSVLVACIDRFTSQQPFRFPLHLDRELLPETFMHSLRTVNQLYHRNDQWSQRKLL